MRHERYDRKREKQKSLEEKIRSALDKKPTKDHILRKGLTIDQISKQLGVKVNIIRKNVKGGRRKIQPVETRPLKSPGTGLKPIDAFIEPVTSIFPTPSLGSYPKAVDVSIIIPLYKSQDVVREQIQSWDMHNDGLTKEIIYVNDCCPNDTYLAVVDEWSKHPNPPVFKIIKNHTNGGFAFACNSGARHACGKYLLFLNADIIVSHDWIKPMIQLMVDDPNIGLVGNLQIRPTGVIDSAGSEWSWKEMTFPHIGRNVYNGKQIEAIKADNIPADLLVAGEREMVTAACIVMPRELFFEIEGFDTNYRIGYWEDTDLNMKVHEAGKKIYYTPESRVIHKVGHSKAWGHRYLNSNRNRFKERWIDTHLIDQWVKHPRKSPPRKIKDHFHGKVVGCAIVCNEEEFLEVSADSVSPLVDEWIIVIGGNEYAYKAGMCKENGYPTDNTLEIAHKIVNKYGGVVIEPPGRLWKDKVEMRNAYASRLLPGEWMFMLDGDEVYKKDQLWKVATLMRTHEVLIMQFLVFWNNIHTIGTGKWEEFPQERIVKWKQGYRYLPKQHLHVGMEDGRLVKQNVPCYAGRENLFFHYSWVRPIEKIRQKLAYYKYQNGTNNDRYVDDIFLTWRNHPELAINKTHPMGGGGFRPYHGLHPAGVQKLIDQGALDFNESSS